MSGMLPSQSCLGVLGGGQLGRMFAQAAQRLGFRVISFDPEVNCPAAQVTHEHIEAAFDDEAALLQLAQRCQAVTVEFENVPAEALHVLQAHTRLAPGGLALRTCQDRRLEKRLFQAQGVACAAHAEVASAADVVAVAQRNELFPAILKTARLGYDGRGQVRVEQPAQLHAAWQALGGVACLLEQRIALAHELSVILARGADGAVEFLPINQNWHHDGILRWSEAPAPLNATQQREAQAASQSLAQALDYVGVLCVEWFVDQQGRLLANEMAPRPHNSGHASLDACSRSQFDWQVRALAGWPLGAAQQLHATVMLNLLGDIWPNNPGYSTNAPDWSPVLRCPSAQLHLYGKAEARPGRKMGHITVLGASLTAARQQALELAQALGVLAPPLVTELV